MKWNYQCPNCKAWISVQWEKREENHKCHNCQWLHLPPSPVEGHEAYVDTQRWPAEIEEVVVSLKGKKCTVPGCNKNYETLDHRVPYSEGGRTSVSNLFPMCNEHNQSKGDSSYLAWFLTLVQG